ncbi:hypothetical protein MPLDJ20_260006 [Mesorhizobium plurifarium]|uniref:Uncharacterized protein n=1 Tax=Mesorhizobium plurifarium TaxID=69974 RepID=A0A090F6E6_MESPL|nr:hypothetical protein MPLDJ20_260006 [Mesorhizobium plurifarium]
MGSAWPGQSTSEPSLSWELFARQQKPIFPSGVHLDEANPILLPNDINAVGAIINELLINGEVWVPGKGRGAIRVSIRRSGEGISLVRGRASNSVQCDRLRRVCALLTG